MKKEFDPSKVGEYLLDELVHVGLMEESSALKLNVSSMLMEAKTEDEYETKGVTIKWDTFKQVYSNYEQYATPAKVLIQLGVPINGLQNNSITTELRRMANHFRDYGKSIDGKGIPSPGKRQEFFSKKGKVTAPDPSMDDIDPGSKNQRNKSTIIVDKINQQEILSGEFYANRTRIPKSRWASWLKFWRQEKHSVKPNPFRTVGRHWGKSFIMGYQVDQHLFVEIWYNSLDSSFSLYDRNGIELGSPVETVQEAIRYLTVQVARMDKSDNEFFGMGMNNGVAQSMMRSLAQGLTADSSVKQREAILKSKMGADDEAYAKGRKDARDSERKRAVRNEKIKRAASSMAQRAATRAAREIMSQDKNKPVDIEDFKLRMASKLKGTSKAAFNFAMDNIADLWNGYYDEFVDAATDRDPNDPWRNGNQRQSSKSQQRQGNTYDHDDIIYHGHDGDSQTSRSTISLPSGEDRNKQKEKEQQDFEKEFTKRHGSGLKNSVEKTKERLDRQRRDLENADTPEERDAILQREREALQKDIEAEGEADETPSNKRGGLGNYYGTIKSRRNLKEGVFDGEGDDGEFKRQMMTMDEPADIDHNKVDQEVRGIRNMAEKSPYTQAALKGKVMGELFDIYKETRADDAMSGGRISRLITNWFGKGRKEKIVSPTDYTPIWDQIRMGLKGQKFRADFILGFTLANKVNVEIWYITEPSGEKSKWGGPAGMVSSYYVYDVTSKTVIRKYLPYYRNAVQVAYAKIGTTI